MSNLPHFTSSHLRSEDYFPDDSALVSLRTEFAQASDKAYWQCLEDRRPSELETKAKMPRNLLLDFFTACVCKLSTSEVNQLLSNDVRLVSLVPVPLRQYSLGSCSPNKRSFRGPGGVRRGLDSLTGPKSVRRNRPLWSPVVSRRPLVDDGTDNIDIYIYIYSSEVSNTTWGPKI